MDICSDPICDPVCDFCWFCVYTDYGEPIGCAKGNTEDFNGASGYCDEFQCRLHEKQPDEKSIE